MAQNKSYDNLEYIHPVTKRRFVFDDQFESESNDAFRFKYIRNHIDKGDNSF